MKMIDDEQYQAKLSRLNKVLIALSALISLQLFALERVLRGWQALDAYAVYSGIAFSAICFTIAMAIYLGFIKCKKC